MFWSLREGTWLRLDL